MLSRNATGASAFVIAMEIVRTTTTVSIGMSASAS